MLKLNDNGITTAANRVEILEYAVKGSALYVEQAKGKRLDCVPITEVQLPTEDEENGCGRWVDAYSQLEKPLLLDMQTANCMLTVHKALKGEKALQNFETLPWHQIAAICWKAVS